MLVELVRPANESDFTCLLWLDEITGEPPTPADWSYVLEKYRMYVSLCNIHDQPQHAQGFMDFLRHEATNGDNALMEIMNRFFSQSEPVGKHPETFPVNRDL